MGTNTGDLRLLSARHDTSQLRSASCLKAPAGMDGELLLDTILNNMSQAVLMFDQAARLIVCNQRYIEMYGLPPEVTRPGCTLHDLLRARVAAGSFSGDPDDYTRDLLDVIAKASRRAA